MQVLQDGRVPAPTWRPVSRFPWRLVAIASVVVAVLNACNHVTPAMLGDIDVISRTMPTLDRHGVIHLLNMPGCVRVEYSRGRFQEGCDDLVNADGMVPDAMDDSARAVVEAILDTSGSLGRPLDYVYEYVPSDSPSGGYGVFSFDNFVAYHLEPGYDEETIPDQYRGRITYVDADWFVVR